MTQANIYNLLIERIKREVRCCMPCIIQSYDAANCTVDIKINIKELFVDAEYDVPVISNVPVVFQRTQQTAITFPLKTGDSGIVIFCDRDIDAWLLNGNNVTPSSKRMHHLNDCIFIPGLFAQNKGMLNDVATDMFIGYKSTTITIQENGNVIIKSSKDINIEAANDINIQSGASANIQVTNDANIAISGNATLNVTGDITSNATNWAHTGNMTLNGALEISKTLNVTEATTLSNTLDVAGAVTTQNGIQNSGSNIVSNGITLETHTHLYEKGITAACSAGGGPVTSTPASTQQPT